MRNLYIVFSVICMLFLSINSFAYDEGDLNDLITEKKCGGTFTSCDLKEVKLVDMDLSGADLEGANLRNAYIENTRFTGANMEGVDFRGATLRYVDMTGAILADAEFENAKLLFVDLSIADMSDSDIENAVFIGVHLKRTKCNDVKFSEIDTKLIDFTGATGIEKGPCAQGSWGTCLK